MSSPNLTHADLTWLASLARALVGDVQAAEDLAQETAAAALQGPMPLGAAPRAWLGGVARRLASRHFRSEARRGEREARAAVPQESPGTAELVERTELAEQVIQAVRRLDEPLRRTVLLRFLEGMETKEIARNEGIPADTVRWRLRRGLAQLRTDLSEGRSEGPRALGAALLPLTRIDEIKGAEGLLTQAPLAASLMTGMMMKAGVLTVVALVGLGLFLTYGRGPEPEAPPRTARADAAVGGNPLGGGKSLDSGPPGIPPGSGRSVATQEPGAVAPEPSPLFGRVTGGDGTPVGGATVFLLGAETQGKGSAGAIARVETDAAGRFRFPETTLPDELLDKGGEHELGVHGNGFLRRVIPNAIADMPREGWAIELEGGGVLAGRVVDPEGRPVPGLRLIAFTAGGGVSHVSPSQRERRSARKIIAGSTSTYFECRAVTDGGGNLRFSGLAAGPAEVLSLDPGWAIQQPAAVETGGGAVTWTAIRCLGARLTVVGEETGAPVDKLLATFNVEVTLDDGSTRPFGQWVGRGDGVVSFVLGEGTLPDLEGRKIIKATFHGRVGTGDRTAEWRAAPLEDPLGITGVAEALVRLPAKDDSTGQPGAAAPMATLELDVRYDDGTPFPRIPVVRWTSTRGAGPALSGNARPKETSPGRCTLRLPAGAVTLRVSDPSAQGSLAPWEGSLDLEAHARELIAVTLPRGGEVRITRPTGFKGNWFTHASWRPEGETEWRGSWTYSTEDDELVLTSMRPAEWRFRLGHMVEEEVVRTAVVSAGEPTIVD